MIFNQWPTGYMSQQVMQTVAKYRLVERLCKLIHLFSGSNRKTDHTGQYNRLQDKKYFCN